MADLTLWGVGTSRTMRAHWMLHELGLDYESRPVQSRSGKLLEEEFKRLNPRYKIPVLQHDSFVLSESAAIIQYLGETFRRPEAVYLPSDPVGRAALNEWCYFIMTELDAGSLYVMRRHEGLAQIYGEAPTAVVSAKTYFSHNLEAMEEPIVRAPYLFGERISAADILLMSCLDWALSAEIVIPATLLDYRNRIVLRPAYQAAFEKNFAAHP
jgi:glutathione S-transferase